MPPYGRSSVSGRLVGLAAAIFLAALAVTAAMNLLLTVWVPLVLSAATVLVLIGIVAAIRFHQHRW